MGLPRPTTPSQTSASRSPNWMVWHSPTLTARSRSCLAERMCRCVEHRRSHTVSCTCELSVVLLVTRICDTHAAEGQTQRKRAKGTEEPRFSLTSRVFCSFPVCALDMLCESVFLPFLSRVDRHVVYRSDKGAAFARSERRRGH